MSPLQRKAILIPSQGVDWSKPSTFIDDRSGFPRNVTIKRNDLMKRPGKTAYGAVMASGQIMGLGIMELPTIKYLLRASKTVIEYYDTIAGWGAITATAFTGDNDAFFAFATVPESAIVIATNGYDKIRKWTGSGNMTALGGNPPLARYATYLSPYLLLAYTDDGTGTQPWKIVWCDTDNPEEWTTGNSGSVLLSDEPSEIMNIKKMNEYVAAYKKNSLWIGRKVETSDIFIFSCMKTGIGLCASRAVVDVEGYHYFMGFNDFYVWNGGTPEPIGGTCRDEVFGTLQRDKMNRCHAMHVQELNEIWFFVVSSGNDWPTNVWKYNYKNGFWYYDTCSNVIASVKWEKVNSLTWDTDIVPVTWDEDIGTWDASDQTAKWEELVMGDKDGYTNYVDYNTTNDMDTAVSSSFESKDFTADKLEFNERWERLDVWCKGTTGGKLYIDYSVDYGVTWVNIAYSSTQAYITLTDVIAKYELYFDVVSDKIRFRFRNSESNEVFYLRNFYPYFLGQEETQSYR